MNAKRKVTVIITARPSYSRIYTALRSIEEHPALELQLVVAGSALLDRYGSVVEVILKDGFKINDKVYMVLEGENPTTMAKTTGIGLLEFSNVLYNLQPDVVVTIADRFETIATSIAAAYQNIPLAHIQGGEVSGNIDEKVRHAITKLADIHFVASKNARERVIKLGENPDFVFNVGCPSIDLAAEVIKKPVLNFDPFEKYGGVGEKFDWKKGYLVVLQHPVTTEYFESRAHVEETLKALYELRIPTFWFWPNVDAGSDGTSKGIRSYREAHNIEHIHFFKNMEPMNFLCLLANSKMLIGNSSVGIRECSFMGVPVINIGSRQNMRERGKNVVDVNYNSEEIKNAIFYWLRNGKAKPSKVYGGGDAGKRIADLLANLPLRFQKTINY